MTRVAKPLVSLGETFLPLFLGFRFAARPKRNDPPASTARPHGHTDGLKAPPTKSRKSALKPLKSFARVNLCAHPKGLANARGRRSLRSPPRFAPPSRVGGSGTGHALEPPPTRRSPPRSRW